MGLVMWMLHIGRARHPGYPGQLSVEFVNVGGWLTYGIWQWILVLTSVCC